MGQRRYPPNRLLAWERLQRGWSYEEVTDRIRAALIRGSETDTGLTANTVRRWETGERWPDPRYRKYLVEIFGQPASELGLLTPQELSMRPQEDALAEFRRLWDVLTGDNGAAGWDRATVLRSLLGAGALPLVAPLLSLQQPEHTSEVESDPEAYQQIVSCQRQLYWTSPPRPLFEAAYAHTQLGVGLLRGAGSGSSAPLASALAQSALLTARLAFFDLSQPAIADRCFEVALAATREAGDHGLAAAVLGHMAFVPAFGHDADGARSLLAAALQHSWHGVSPVVRSWLHCVASEVEGRAGAGATARHQIDLATAAIDKDAATPEWLDFYDAGRLHCFAGYAALAADDQVEAANHLTSALDSLGPNGGKQRSVILADLATAYAADGERAASYLHQAIDTLTSDWYSTGFIRVRAVRPVLTDSTHGKHIDERIAALAAVSRAALPSR